MPEDLWPAPTPPGSVVGEASVPGSKSIANRALVLAAAATGPSTITGLPSEARDIRLMMQALGDLGTDLAPQSATSGVVTVQPGVPQHDLTVDCGLAGTVMRFLPPLAAFGEYAVTFDGDDRARERPMAAMLTALRSTGVTVEDGGTARLPFTILGSGAALGGQVQVDASASSQFVTALLLSGARFDEGVRVIHRGAPVPSLPHIDMTCRMLAEHGVEVAASVSDPSDAWWEVSPGPIRPVDRTIEPDLSNALPLAAAALITGGQVLIRAWPERSLQPSRRVLGLLESLGGRTRATGEGMQISGGARVRGIDVDLRDVGELVPTIAAVCALAESPSHLRGIGHISGHETDRIAALAREINALGGDVTATSDALVIRPRPLHGGVWRTYRDHRMATAGAIIGLRTEGVLVENIATTAKTFPTFPQVWQRLVDPRPQPGQG